MALQLVSLSSRGIHPRDPLSPLLFVIVMEALSRLITKAVSGGYLSGFSIDNVQGDSMVISHFHFANDTLLFWDANSTHIWYLRCILVCFEAVSSLRIYLGKSEIVPVGEVPIPNIEELADALGAISLPFPWSIWELLLRRLVDWKMNLSNGGCLTLIKSTYLALHLFLFSFPFTCGRC